MFFLNKFNELYKKWKGDESIRTKLMETYNDAIDELKELREKFKDLRRTNYELGIYHLENNNISDALFRFSILELFGFHEPALKYYIAHCYMDQFKYEKAKKYIELYYASEDKEFLTEIEYYKLVIEKKDVNKIPERLVSDRFDQLSSNYEKFSLINKKDSHQLVLASAVLKVVNTSAKPIGNNILDIGCGTGIIGQILKESRIANAIVGVDLSQKMLEKASNRMFDNQKVYMQVFNTEAIAFLNQSQPNNSVLYDIIIASDFITFYNDLDKLIKLLKSFSHERTVLAISFKQSEVREISFSHKIGEFKYNTEFVKNVFNLNNWTIVLEEKINFSNQNAGILMIFMKNLDIVMQKI